MERIHSGEDRACAQVSPNTGGLCKRLCGDELRATPSGDSLDGHRKQVTGENHTEAVAQGVPRLPSTSHKGIVAGRHNQLDPPMLREHSWQGLYCITLKGCDQFTQTYVCVLSLRPTEYTLLSLQMRSAESSEGLSCSW